MDFTNDILIAGKTMKKYHPANNPLVASYFSMLDVDIDPSISCQEHFRKAIALLYLHDLEIEEILFDLLGSLPDEVFQVIYFNYVSLN